MGSDYEILDTLGISVLGMGVVFLVLILLMGIIMILTASTKALGKKKLTAPADAVPVPPAAEEPARGSCGELRLNNVSDRDAALVMAVVADELKTPLNELRFISIRELEDKENEI
jgi:Na+-transporting methylmalonyl-CoA/oxaloacetate decarboxylase gamma subunit